MKSSKVMLLLHLLLILYSVSNVFSKLAAGEEFLSIRFFFDWGLIFGVIFFQEQVTAGKLVGICFVVCGVILFACGEKADDEA